MSENYDDILHLPHHISKTRPRMSRQNRAAQFSPFAALTGYEAVIRETARLTDYRTELTEDEMAELDARLRLAVELDAEVTVTWFKSDAFKDGGSYISTAGHIEKVDELNHILIVGNGIRIPIQEITAIDGVIFNSINQTRESHL